MAADGEQEQSADLVAHEESTESVSQEESAEPQTTEPPKEEIEQDAPTELSPTDALSDATPEELLTETTEAEPQTTPAVDEAEPARRRRDVQEANESEAVPKEASSDNQIESEATDDDARQFNRRPYPIRPGLRRPFVPQRNGPVYNDYGILSRTAEYCYTFWCRFKTSLRRIL